MLGTIGKVVSFTLAGLVAAFMMHTAYEYVRYDIYLYKPMSQIFEGHVVVPDFKVGDDPVVDYTRTIHSNFYLRATNQVIDAVTGIPACTRQAAVFMYPNKKIDTSKLHMSYFLGTCPPLKVGQYYIAISLDLIVDQFPDRHTTIVSNIFHVLPS